MIVCICFAPETSSEAPEVCLADTEFLKNSMVVYDQLLYRDIMLAIQNGGEGNVDYEGMNEASDKAFVDPPQTVSKVVKLWW